MPTLRDLRLQARLSINALAHLARVDRKTVERAEEGQPVQDAKAYAIVETLGQQLGRDIKLEDVDDLQVL